MNEFERKIHDALAASRSKTLPTSPHTLTRSGEVAAGAAGVAGVAGAAFGARALAAKRRTATSSDAEPVAPAVNDPAVESGTVTRGETPVVSVHSVLNRAALNKPGVIMGCWDNALIAAAMPVLLQAERARGQDQLNATALRARLVQEIRHFQQTLLKAHIAPDDVDRLAYLLCSYIDECCLGAQGTDEFNLSLLVEFYRDAWGGEKCFDHLEGYLTAAPRDDAILAFYDLILSLGFEGKYHVMERGAVLLADVRQSLDRYLYKQNPTQTLADAHAQPVVRRRQLITPLKLTGYGLLLALLAWGGAAWYLHQQSRALRNAILAWTPPIPKKINIMETLPQPLPQILSEGWLEVRADPRGWLLIFTSDGAFATGESRLSEEFKKKRNIERLGEALAPWPGDLEVIGHTDNKPYRGNTGNNNQKLSEARARTVADILRAVLATSRYQREVTAVGKGETEPLADNATEEGRRRNRRVDILWKIGRRETTPPPVMTDDDVFEFSDKQ